MFRRLVEGFRESYSLPKLVLLAICAVVFVGVLSFIVFNVNIMNKSNSGATTTQSTVTK